MAHRGSVVVVVLVFNKSWWGLLLTTVASRTLLASLAAASHAAAIAAAHELHEGEERAYTVAGIASKSGVSTICVRISIVGCVQTVSRNTKLGEGEDLVESSSHAAAVLRGWWLLLLAQLLRRRRPSLATLASHASQ